MRKYRKIAWALVLMWGFSVSLSYAQDTGLSGFKDLEGKIDIAGGTAHIPVMKDAAEAIMKANPKIHITVAGGGSGVGVQKVGGRAQGTHQIGLVRHQDRFPKAFFQKSLDAWIMGHAACEEQGPGYTHPVQHGHGARDDGQVQTYGNIGRSLTPGHEAGGLTFCEYGAHAADLNAAVGLQREIAKFLQGHLQGHGHEFQEFSRACGATVVHLKLGHLAFFGQSNGFGVLTADV